MAQSAKTAEKAAATVKNATEQTAERGHEAMDQATELAHETAERAEGGLRRGLQVVERAAGGAAEMQREVAQRSVDGTADLGQTLTRLCQEQARQNVQTWTALMGAVDWDQVVKAVDWERVTQIQGEYLRLSLERGARLTQRYFEVGQSVLGTANAAFQRQAQKAA